jgi:hypothetical protein
MHMMKMMSCITANACSASSLFLDNWHLLDYDVLC